MAAKIESPSLSKLSPSDRLARKRAAARLRQQRCRARKRQISIDQRRQENVLRREGMSQDSRPEFVQDKSALSSRQAPSSPPMEPIFNCVSFESQRSFEEGQRPLHGTSPRGVEDVNQFSNPSSPQDSRKPMETIIISKGQPESQIVSEEEAAVAAMLSLKSGSTEAQEPAKKIPPKSEPAPRTSVVRSAPRTGNYRSYYGGWEPRRYEGFEYGRSRPYYIMPPRVPPPYRYYPTYTKGYTRYDYE